MPITSSTAPATASPSGRSAMFVRSRRTKSSERASGLSSQAVISSMAWRTPSDGEVDMAASCLTPARSGLAWGGLRTRLTAAEPPHDPPCEDGLPRLGTGGHVKDAPRQEPLSTYRKKRDFEST